MRYPKDRKEQTRKKIIEAAVCAFTKHGVKGIGIADIMKQAGLTPGAFSRHFTSKEQLLREALDEGFKQTPFMPPEMSKDPLESLIRIYLSPGHRDSAEKACLASVLAPEIARHPQRTRELFVAHLKKNFQEIDDKFPNKKRGLEQRKKSMAVFALLMGTLQMARVAEGTELSDQILKAGIEAAMKLIAEN